MSIRRVVEPEKECFKASKHEHDFRYVLLHIIPEDLRNHPDFGGLKIDKETLISLTGGPMNRSKLQYYEDPRDSECFSKHTKDVQSALISHHLDKKYQEGFKKARLFMALERLRRPASMLYIADEGWEKNGLNRVYSKNISNLVKSVFSQL